MGLISHGPARSARFGERSIDNGKEIVMKLDVKAFALTCAILWGLAGGRST